MTPDVTFVGHATVLFDVGGCRVLTDPLLRDRVTFLQRVTPVAGPIVDVDVVLLSHLHQDHCDIPTLRTLNHVPIVAPVGSGDFLAEQLERDVVELAVGSSISIGSTEITAVRAIHDGGRPPFGPVAQAVGYVCHGPVGSVYFAGDTDIYPGMGDIGSSIARLDVALLPVWGWGPNLGAGHMNPARAARATAQIEPRLAIPIHWGTYFPMGMRRVLGSSRVLLHRPPEVFAELAARYAPESEVVVLQPGEQWCDRG